MSLEGKDLCDVGGLKEERESYGRIVLKGNSPGHSVAGYFRERTALWKREKPRPRDETRGRNLEEVEKKDAL